MGDWNLILNVVGEPTERKMIMIQQVKDFLNSDEYWQAVVVFLGHINDNNKVQELYRQAIDLSKGKENDEKRNELHVLINRHKLELGLNDIAETLVAEKFSINLLHAKKLLEQI